MGAVRMVARSEVRQRTGRLALITILVAVVGAVVLSTAAGARRTASSLERFRTASRSADLEVFVGDATPAQMAAFRRVPGVAAFAAFRGSALSFPKARNLQDVAGAVDDRFGRVVDRPRILAGRAADLRAVDEVTVGEALAAQLHLRVGDHLDARGFTPAQVQMFLCACGFPAGAVSSGPPVPQGPSIRFHVVGIVRRPLDLGDRGASGGVLIATPAFTRHFATTIGSFNGGIVRVRTRHGGAELQRVTAAARRIFGGSPEFQTQDLAIDTQGAQNAIDVLSAALWILAGVSALAGTVALAIMLSREVALTGRDAPTQRALGVTRRQRVAVGVLPAVPVALGGALLAVGVAIAASPLFPTGVARRAEPRPGLHVDPLVLGLGAAAVAALVVTIALVASVRASRVRTVDVETRLTRTSAAIDASSRAGVPPVVSTGFRMALERGRGRSAVPIRSAIFGAVFGIVGIVAVSTFASSLDHLVASPHHYGWNWDFAAVVDDPGVFRPSAPLRHVAGIDALTELETVNVQVDGHPVIAWGYTPLHGNVGAVTLAGRAPRGHDEIALGSATLDQIGKSVGDVVRAAGPGGTHTYRIVGRAAFPKLDVVQPVANGAVLTGSGMALIVDPSDTNTTSHYVLVRASSRTPRLVAERRVTGSSQYGIEGPITPSVPVEVNRLQQIGWLPATLGALLAFLATVAVGHALVTSIRRRRHELAILKTVGFDRRQVRAAVAWQATTLATIGIVVGIPLGIIVGALVWRGVADNVGVGTDVGIPAVAIGLTVAGALAIANLVAFLPGRATARIRPAAALRTE
jgi:ABC-type lipoprotein release transport system permease subunit